MKVGQEKNLPADTNRIIRQTASGTIRNVFDAIVELITNSDDSYKRLEKEGISVSGEIELTVSRKVGGKCEFIKVQDYAEGMDKETLQAAIVYGGSSSGYKEINSVRGLFGRGLKESIISLGRGDIYTRKDGITSAVRIWMDRRGNVKYATLGLNKEETEQLGLKQNGTIVLINNIDEKFKIPSYEKFEKIFQKHYALRDINSNNKRKIALNFITPKATYSTPIKYSYLAGELIVNEPLKLEDFQEKLTFKLFKSEGMLSPPSNGRCWGTDQDTWCNIRQSTF